jgi:hypothetical protein
MGYRNGHLRIIIREASRGLLPSKWQWEVEHLMGGCCRTIASGTTDTPQEAALAVLREAQLREPGYAIPVEIGASAIVEGRAAQIVGYSERGIFITFNDCPEIGAWAYDPTDIIPIERPA